MTDAPALIGLIIASPVSALKAIMISETTAKRTCPSKSIKPYLG